ncbi:MAG: homoserine kinase [Gammaproteobacteria bacterium]|nr:MAG: homoserine kinase [Gammaproteobacteria bacterium]
MSVTSATAFAPASVGNVGIGFDILGHTFPALGDRVRARRSAAAGVRITAIGGVVRDLPLEAAQNTAGMAVQALLEAVQPGFGVELEIEKGIPLGSGLGGSAASAVAGVVAANALLPEPRPALELLRYAMRGEAVASGAVHVDNIAPSLFGGLVLTVGIDNPRIKQIPVPPMIRCVLVHPRMFLGTREARGILNRSVDLADVVWQTANLAGFLAGCYTSDLAMIRDAFEDVMIEPQRARLIPGFAEVKRAAMDRGALGCSISGAGPSVFAWCEEAQASAIAAAMAQAFAGEGLESDQWVAAIEAVGARVEETS